MRASHYCACRTAALRIFVRSLVGRAPTSTLTSAFALTTTRTYAASPSTALSTQLRIALRSDARIGQTTALRAIHASRRCAALAAPQPGSTAAEATASGETTEAVRDDLRTIAATHAGENAGESTGENAGESTDETAKASPPPPPPPAPTTPGKNMRKKLRRRREAEAQAEALIKEYEAQAATQPAGDAPGVHAAVPAAPASMVSDKRKQRKLLRAARRAQLNDAARKEELADQILSRRQRQAKQKEKAAKQQADEKTDEKADEKADELADKKADEAALAERKKRRLEKKLRGKAERLAVLAENDPAKYAEIEAKRVKKEMKKERRAERLEKKRLLEAKSKQMRAKREDKTDKTDKDKAEPKKEPEPWQVQKKALQQKFPEGWKPRKKLSPDALEGIRALHKQMPETYTTAVLAAHFEVSPEAIRRILKSKWQAKPEEEEDRQMRWFERGKQVWTRWAALGKKPPKQWRREGILRDASWTGSRKRAQAAREEAREAYEDQPTRQARIKAEEPHLLRGKSRRVHEREEAEQDGQAGLRRGGGSGGGGGGGYGRGRDGRGGPRGGPRERGPREDRGQGTGEPSGPYDW